MSSSTTARKRPSLGWNLVVATGRVLLRAFLLRAFLLFAIRRRLHGGHVLRGGRRLLRRVLRGLLRGRRRLRLQRRGFVLARGIARGRRADVGRLAVARLQVGGDLEALFAGARIGLD